MGLFKALQSAISTGAEVARGDRVASEIQLIMENLTRGPEDFRLAVLDGFLTRRLELQQQKQRWTPEQQRRAGKDMFDAAKKAGRGAHDRTGEVESYVVGLAALWLESGAPASERAAIAHATIENMIRG